MGNLNTAWRMVSGAAVILLLTSLPLAAVDKTPMNASFVVYPPWTVQLTADSQSVEFTGTYVKVNPVAGNPAIPATTVVPMGPLNPLGKIPVGHLLIIEHGGGSTNHLIIGDSASIYRCNLAGQWRGGPGDRLVMIGTVQRYVEVSRSVTTTSTTTTASVIP